jgi:serine phosphatase RsbU (regulator of sigma subunit)
MPEETILVVDDETANLQKLHRTFVHRYAILSASSGKEALALAAANPSIAVIIADQRMPDMTGTEFLKQTLKILPNAIRIILTGFTDIDVLVEAINQCKVFRYLVKPWDPPDLLITVERGLEAYRLAEENASFRKELIRRERLARELEIARDIQRYILPPDSPGLKGYEMGVAYHPAREVGGDLYDYHWNPEALQIVIGDVSGKSIPAALYGAVFSGRLQALFSQSTSPARALETLNSNLVARYPVSNYIAVAFCRIDLESGAGILSNGGMPFPLLVRNGKADRLEIGGIPLGLMANTAYKEIPFVLEPGDTFILASDGTTDALNPSGEFYDIERFTESICRNSRYSVDELPRRLYNEIHEFTAGAELNDDITIIALKRTG